MSQGQFERGAKIDQRPQHKLRDFGKAIVEGMQSIAEGIGTIGMFGQTRPPEIMSPQDTMRADARAIASDYRAVGGDMNAAYRDIKKNH